VSIIEKITKRIGEIACHRAAAHVKVIRDAKNFEQAKKIGILYDATDLEEFEIVKEYAKVIREERKEVKALGFVNEKETQSNQMPTIDLDFFTKKDLNWYHKPGGYIVENFINTEYDILISLNFNDCYPLQYISAVSKAKFRVGKYDEKYKLYYDLMIDLQNNNNLSYFIELVNHYINMINREKGADIPVKN